MRIEFYPFANVNNTIRMRAGRVACPALRSAGGRPGKRPGIHCSHSAGENLSQARRTQAHWRAIGGMSASHDISAKAHLVRQMRGRKRIDSPQGDIFHLEEIFEELNLALLPRTAGAAADDMEPDTVAAKPGALRSRPTTPSW